MSAYICFWIRANSGGPYICLDSWSRSTQVYQAMEHQVSYGTFKELAAENLREGIEVLEGAIESYKDMIRDEESTIKFLQGCAHLNVEQLREEFFDCNSSITETQKEIEDCEFAITQLRTFWQILDEQEYGNDTGKLYFSHECNPNYREDNENEENQV